MLLGERNPQMYRAKSINSWSSCISNCTTQSCFSVIAQLLPLGTAPHFTSCCVPFNQTTSLIMPWGCLPFYFMEITRILWTTKDETVQILFSSVSCLLQPHFLPCFTLFKGPILQCAVDSERHITLCYKCDVCALIPDPLTSESSRIVFIDGAFWK